MTDRRQELLRPKDATSWDEFQARWVIERGGRLESLAGRNPGRGATG
jgi:hypothetical protein